MDLQPIETAPRDGTLVQIYARHCGVPTVQLARWKDKDAPFLAGWWTQSSPYRQDMVRWVPSHWAPFTPPEEGKPYSHHRRIASHD
jgi:hypothetical protein